MTKAALVFIYFYLHTASYTSISIKESDEFDNLPTLGEFNKRKSIKYSWEFANCFYVSILCQSVVSRGDLLCHIGTVGLANYLMLC